MFVFGLHTKSKMRKALLLLLPLVTRQSVAVSNTYRLQAPAELRGSFSVDALPSRLRPAFTVPFRAPLLKGKYACTSSILRGGGLDKTQILRNAYNAQQYVCLVMMKGP